jgi:hypothetical protein
VLGDKSVERTILIRCKIVNVVGAVIPDLSVIGAWFISDLDRITYRDLTVEYRLLTILINVK